jgi:Flp pilus assembly protein TadD
MRSWVVLLAIVAAGCAGVPGQPADDFLADRLFAAPADPVDASDIFAMSPEMARFIATDAAQSLRVRGPRRGLLEALYRRDGLQLEYDSTFTRNAAQAFAARAGNCLSLVIMTGAFAKALGIDVTYNQVYVDDAVSRLGDIYLSIGHVNLTLGERTFTSGTRGIDRDAVTIDFMPPRDIRGLRSRPIAERTIAAMYMNNRAVESLAGGRIDDAYWRVRAAVLQDPEFTSAYNTLGAVYARHGDFAQSERVLRHALLREPSNPQVVANLVQTLDALGRATEANEFRRKLAELEPNPPFGLFRQGLVAMREGDYRRAQALFAEEVERAPYHHEFHFWLAAASAGLGELDRARREMMLAIESSPTRGDRELYAAKLERIEAHRLP